MSKILSKFTSLTEYYKILYQLLTKIKTIKTLYVILFLNVLIISAFFEISLLGFLFVLIKAFMDPNYYQGNFFFKFFLNIFNIKNNAQLILFLSLFFILACIIAGIFRLFFYYLISIFVYFFGKNITSICYQKIIYQDYTSLFLKNTNDSLSIFQKMPIVNNSIFATLLMVYNFITFIFIFSILSYIDFQITIYASLFFISIYLFVILIFKKKIFFNASVVSNEQIINIKIVRETINGFRDILINNYQKFYNNLFLKSYSKLMRGNEENRFFYSAPRPIIETFLLASIGVIISLNAENYKSLEELIPMIAVLAVASQRILPILNQLYSGHMENVNASPHTNFILNFCKRNTNSISRKKSKPIKFKDKILLKNISFTYPLANEKVILNNINLNISAGSRVGIIGRSGSGKSTLADLILGLLNPTSGDILVDNKSILNKKENWFSCVASVPQNIFITEQSIAENIAFGKTRNNININEVKNAAKKAQLSEFIETRKNKYYDVIGEKGLKISAGQRQRIAIARALYKNSKLIIFDEATSSLDTEAEKNVMDTIFSLSRKHHTSIIITHKLNNLKRCDHIYKIQNSKIIKFK
tara:strand:+ start:10880 stop:12643 length:1764 start_codon:yes stop_codon:yes gene_type:complete